MRRIKTGQILPLLLALAMCLSLLPTPVFAAEAAQGTQASQPAEVPDTEPGEEPTEEPAEMPTEAPSEEPTEESTEAPSEEPTEESTEAPSEEPTEESTEAPSEEPIEAPEAEPTEEPAETPSEAPGEEPTETPDAEPAAELDEDPDEEPDTEPVEELAEQGIQAGMNGLTFSVSGLLPEGSTLQVIEAPPTIERFLREDVLGLMDLAEKYLDYSTYAYDIKILDAGGQEWQPESPVSVMIGGVEADEDREIFVYHFPTTMEVLTQAVTKAAPLMFGSFSQSPVQRGELTGLGQGAEKPANGGILAWDDLSGAVTMGNGKIEFLTDSFSTYYVVSGKAEDIKIDWDFYSIGKDENPVFYLAPGTTIQVAAQSKWGSSLTPARTQEKVFWTVVDDNSHGNIKVDRIKDERYSYNGKPNNTAYVNNFIYVLDSATEGDSLKFRLNERKISDHSQEGSYYSHVTVIVMPEKSIVAQCLNNDSYPVMLAVLQDSRSIPGEPGDVDDKFFFADSSYSFFNKSKKFADTAKGVIAPSIVDNPNFINSVDGTNSMGIVDQSGAATRAVAAGVDWKEALQKIADKKGKKAVGSDGSKVTSANVSNYELIPYVVKLQTAHSIGWHIDCKLVQKSSVTLSYYNNLPPGEGVSGLSVPDGAAGTPPFNVIVEAPRTGFSAEPLGEGETVITISGKELTFLGWTTEADGSGTIYTPGDPISVSQNTTLYAKWTGYDKGTLRVENRVIVPETSQPPPVENQTFTFTITPGDGISHSYEVYHQDKSLIESGSDTTITVNLTDGQYVLVRDIADGSSYTVTQMPIEDYTTDPSSLEQTGQIRGGETVTASFINIYSEPGAPDMYYTLIYDANGGEEDIVPEPETHQAGAKVELKTNPKPVYADHVFKGWSTDKEHRFVVESVYITKNTTVYAVWNALVQVKDARGQEIDKVEEGETVTVDLAGGAWVPAQQGWQDEGGVYTKIAVAGEDVRLSDPTKEHNTFTGWTSMEAGDGSLIVTAQWNPTVYTATITVDDGVTGVEDAVEEDDGSYTLNYESSDDTLQVTLNVDPKYRITGVTVNGEPLSSTSNEVVLGEKNQNYTVSVTTAPNPPSGDELKLLGDVSVGVDCSTEGHDERTYRLLEGSFTIGEVGLNSSKTAYECTVTIAAERYLTEYDETYVSHGHTVAQDADSVQVALTWSNGQWTRPEPAQQVGFRPTCDNTYAYEVYFYRDTVESGNCLGDLKSKAPHGSVIVDLNDYTESFGKAFEKLGEGYSETVAEFSDASKTITEIEQDNIITICFVTSHVTYQPAPTDGSDTTGTTVTRNVLPDKTIIVNLDGGSWTMEPADGWTQRDVGYSHGTAARGNVTLPNPTKAGCVFTGWDTRKDDGGNLICTANYRLIVTPIDPPPASPPPPIPPVPPPAPPVTPGGGGTTIIEEEDVPLTGAPGLNSTDHYAYLIGREDGTIAPNARITRAEVATIFFRLMTDEFRTANWATASGLSDLTGEEWFNNAACTTARAGIIKGKNGGAFHGGDCTTRAEFAAMAARFLSESYEGPDLYEDIKGHWAAGEINRAARAGWFRGAESFRPNDFITRAEVVATVNRMLDRVPDAEHMLEDMIVWPDNQDKTAWYYADIQEATNSHDYDRAGILAAETWTGLLGSRDWAALETQWAAAAEDPGGDVTEP